MLQSRLFKFTDPERENLKRAVRKYVFFFQRGANWAFDGVFRAKLVSEDAFSLCLGSG